MRRRNTPLHSLTWRAFTLPWNGSVAIGSVSSQTQIVFDLRQGHCFPLADLFEGVAHFPRLGGCQGVVGVMGKRRLRQDGEEAAVRLYKYYPDLGRRYSSFPDDYTEAVKG